MAQNVHNFYAALAAPSPGQITAGPSYIPTMLGIAVQNATTAERNQFQVLQQQHLQHLVQTGKAVYFLPRGMGMKMGQPILQGIADQLSLLVASNVFVHFDITQLVYRIGQVSDQQDLDDTAGLSMVYCAQFTPPAVANVPAPAQNLPLTAANAEKIPKPRNKWILYRQSKHREIVAQNPGIHTSEISKIIGQMWRLELPSVISKFEKLAEAEKAAHLRKYPGYRARNRRPAEIKRRNKNVTSIVVNKSARSSNKPTAAQLNSEASQAYEKPDINISSLSNSDVEEMDLEKFMAAMNEQFDSICAQAGKISAATDNIAAEQSTQYYFRSILYSFAWIDLSYSSFNIPDGNNKLKHNK